MAGRPSDTAAGRRVGRARAAALDGLDLTLGELDGLADAMGGAPLLALLQEHTLLMERDAQARAAWGKSGRYREAIRSKVFDNPDGPVGSVFVIQGPWTRNLARLWPRNLPIWLEYGTRRMGARPHLLPALAAGKERFSAALLRLLASRVTP